MAMHRNSLEAYWKELNSGHITQARGVVYREIKANGPITRQRLGINLRKPPNVVTPRVKELIDSCYVVECGDIVEPDLGNKYHALCRVTTPEERDELLELELAAFPCRLRERLAEIESERDDLIRWLAKFEGDQRELF